MIRQLTLGLAALGFMIAVADASEITAPAAPSTHAAAVEATHLKTGRSAWHRHWHRPPPRHWHHHH